MIKNRAILTLFSAVLAILCTTASYANKKDDFVNQLLPSINAVNTEITTKRQRLISLDEKRKTASISQADRSWLTQLASEYKISKPDFKQDSTWSELKKKVDVIPPSLAIAQAATESGWGNSRYAKVANNYFGQSCFRAGCGMKPKTNKSRFYYEAATFRSVHDAVRGYVNNLNTHNAYKELRRIRHQQRQQNHPPESLQLAKGLQRYSERGNAYVTYISNMIKKLQPRKLDQHLV